MTEFRRSSFIQKRSNLLNITPFLRSALDLSEASAIQLALNENIYTVYINEHMGRRVARLNGLKLTGSIGVLIRAKQDGFDLSMHEAINRNGVSGYLFESKGYRFRT